MLWRLRKPTRDKLRILGRDVALVFSTIVTLAAAYMLAGVEHRGLIEPFLWSVALMALATLGLILIVFSVSALFATVDVWPTIEERWREEMLEATKDINYEYDVARHEYKRVK